MVDMKKSPLAAGLSVTVILAGVLGVHGSVHATTLANVTTTNDPNTLANTILGSGVTVSAPTYTGTPDAAGVFSNGNAAGLGIDSGILLSTGKAVDAANPSSFSASTDNGTPGDTQLSALLPGKPPTFDAAALQFNFTLAPGSNSLYFNYAFASEEYPKYVNSKYNDVFALSVDGKNIATVPATNTPVSINTVNGGNPLGTDATNPKFYVNNLTDTGTLVSKNIAYDGFTVPFTAAISDLSPGEHTLKLAIADTSDHVLDSAVFIQAKTVSNQVVAPVPSSTAPVPVPSASVPVPEPTASVPVPEPCSTVPVPEPSSTLGTLAFGALGTGYMLKRKFKKQKSVRHFAQ